MSKIKDFIVNSGIVGRIVAFFVLIVWVLDLVGCTGYLFWASKTLVASGMIHSGFGFFGVVNLLVSLFALPVAIYALALLLGKLEDIKRMEE